MRSSKRPSLAELPMRARQPQGKTRHPTRPAHVDHHPCRLAEVSAQGGKQRTIECNALDVSRTGQPDGGRVDWVPGARGVRAMELSLEGSGCPAAAVHDRHRQARRLARVGVRLGVVNVALGTV